VSFSHHFALITVKLSFLFNTENSVIHSYLYNKLLYSSIGSRNKTLCDCRNLLNNVGPITDPRMG